MRFCIVHSVWRDLASSLAIRPPGTACRKPFVAKGPLSPRLPELYLPPHAGTEPRPSMTFGAFLVQDGFLPEQRCRHHQTVGSTSGSFVARKDTPWWHMR